VRSLISMRMWGRRSPLAKVSGVGAPAKLALKGVFFVQLLRPDLRKASEIAAEIIARAEEDGSSIHQEI
jgi:hypothetical protein